MFTTIKLMNTLIIMNTLASCGCVVKIFPFSQFQVYDTTLLTIITLQSIRFPELIYLV